MEGAECRSVPRLCYRGHGEGQEGRSALAWVALNELLSPCMSDPVPTGYATRPVVGGGGGGAAGVGVDMCIFFFCVFARASGLTASCGGCCLL